MTSRQQSQPRRGKQQREPSPKPSFSRRSSPSRSRIARAFGRSSTTRRPDRPLPETACARVRTVKVTMLLADFAQVSDGKLTVVGGGWSLTGPEMTPFGIALLVQVPWDQANRRHTLRLE